MTSALPRIHALLTPSSRVSSRIFHNFSGRTLAKPQVPSSRQFHLSAYRMAAQVTKFKLSSGQELPAIGFGTWQDADAQEQAVLEALKAGYRHIDGAHIYGTEPQVCRAIQQSGVPRSEIFITTKLWNNAHHPDDVEKQLDKSLQNLGTDYVDLWLMHWPAAFARSDEMFPKDSEGNNKPGDTDYVDTWKAMIAMKKKGKAKAIGVSNFNQDELERIIKETGEVPTVHQLEMHPYLQQKSFADFHKSKNIHITQYSPFGNQNEIYGKGQKMSKLIDDPTLNEIGKKYGKNGAQVALAWGIANGHSVIPKSKTPSRIRDNLGGDFKLSQEDVDKVSTLDKKVRFNDPSTGFKYTFYQGLDGKE